MNPYEVEIFDRNFNYIYNALVDEKDFDYKFDVLSPEKNTVPVPKDFKPTTMSEEPRAPKGWYIRIFRDGEEYQGVISGFEEGETQGKIEYSQLITLFDLEIAAGSQDITMVSIESYINAILTNAFISNSDTVQRIPGLTVSYSGNTRGSLSYCNTDNPFVSINILKDLISEAYASYGIYTKIYADFSNKRIYADIRIINAAAPTIEGDLPNICDAEFTIRKQANTEVNKVIIKDTYYGTEYLFYLYDDGTYGTNPSPTGKARVFPTVTKVILMDLNEMAKNLVDAKYQTYINLVASYTRYGATIPGSIWGSFYAACSSLMQKYIDLVGLDKYKFSFDRYSYWSESGELWVVVDMRQDGLDSFGGDPVITQGQTYFETFGSDNKDIMYGYKYDTQYNYYGHAAIRASGEVVGVRKLRPSSIDFDEDVEEWNHNEICFTESLAKTAFSAYQNTGDYLEEIADMVVSEQVRDAVESKAKYEFSNNKYNNLIELTVKKDDLMIDPLNMELGQEVNVIHDGVSYNSILSGREVQKDGMVKLIFGTIRLELTKILNMKGV